MSNSEKIELHNEVINDLLQQPPSWLTRWGLTIFLICVVIIITFTYYIRYPDTIDGSIRIVTTVIPKSINSRADGLISNLLVRDNNFVRKGQLLGTIQSTAKYNSILLLDEFLEKVIRDNLRGHRKVLSSIQIPKFENFGELQKSYQDFQEKFVNFKLIVNEGPYKVYRELLVNDINQLNIKYENLQMQQIMYENDLNLSNEELKMQTTLLKDKTISQAEYRISLSKFINKKQILIQNKGNLQDINLLKNDKKKQIIEIDRNVSEKENELFQSLNTLKSEIENWKLKFLLVAPEDGQISFINNVQENLNVKTNQELMYLLPKKTLIYGEVLVGQFNLGKLKLNQRVIIKFPSHPFQEFGFVEGEVEKISDITRGNDYVVLIRFPNGLKTNYKKNIKFRYNLTGFAEIITNDITVFDRIFFLLRKMNYNQQ